jgi:dolichyl-phosphate beta-glucosyltransferase
MHITYVLPVHNEEKILRLSVGALAERLVAFPGSEIIMVENGSTDGSARLVGQLAEEYTSRHIKVVDGYSPKGFGNAYREGLGLSSGHLIVLSAADLPFGFSDLESYLALTARSHLVIGSKGHPDSRVEVNATRRVASWIYRLVRRVLIGMDVRDSQGTLLLHGDLARRLLPMLTSSDYFVSTEIIALAHAYGVEPIEVPINYTNPRSDSKVRPVRDGWRMLRQLIALRRRLKSITPIDEYPPAINAT